MEKEIKRNENLEYFEKKFEVEMKDSYDDESISYGCWEITKPKELMGMVACETTTILQDIGFDVKNRKEWAILFKSLGAEFEHHDPRNYAPETY